MKNFFLDIYHKNKIGVALAVIFVLAATPCIKWGLPSAERASIVLRDELKNDDFYRSLKEIRRGIYAKIGGNPSAYAGRKIAEGGSYDAGITRQTAAEPDGTVILRPRKNGGFPPEILLAVNSFLLRSEHPHEQEMLNAISKMRPSQLDFNPGFYRYGGSYVYALAGLYFILSKIGYMHLSSDTTYYLARPDEMAKFYIAGRLLSVFCGGLMILFTYAVAKKLYNEKVSLLSGVIALLLPVIFVDSCAMRPQVYAAAWAMCGIWLSLGIEDLKQNFQRLFLASVCLGVALGAALNSWIYLIFPSVVFVVKSAGRKRRLSDILISRDFISLNLTIFLIAGATYFVTNPYVIFNIKSFIDELRWMSSFRRINYLPLNFFAVNLREILGTVLVLAFTGAVVRSIVKKDEEGDKILALYLLPALAYVAVYFGGAVETGAANLRYHLPLVLLIAVWCSSFLVKGICLDNKFARRSFIVILALIIIPVGTERAVYSLRFHQSAGKESINLKAGRWINENIPPGSSIGILKYTPHTDSTPPFRFTDYVLIGDYEHAILVDKNFSRLARPDYFVIMENPDYEKLKEISQIEEWIDRYYTVRYRIEMGILPYGLPVRMKNNLGYGEQPVVIYERLRRDLLE